MAAVKDMVSGPGPGFVYQGLGGSFGSETHQPKENLDPKFGGGKIKFK